MKRIYIYAWTCKLCKSLQTYTLNCDKLSMCKCKSNIFKIHNSQAELITGNLFNVVTKKLK